MSPSKSHRILPLFFAAFALAASAAADTTNLTPGRDQSITADSVPAGDGSGAFLFAGFDPTSDLPWRALLHFDVPGALPPGAIVNSVELRLTIVGGQSACFCLPHNLSGLAEDWSENATWGQRVPPTLLWATPGGTTNGLVAMAPGSATAVVFSSTPSFVARVQSWLDQPSTNHGVLMSNGDATISFASSEHPTAALRPQLVVDWTPGCTATNHCIGAVNSRGSAAHIAAIGSSSVAQNAFGVSVTGGVPSSSAFLIFADGQQQIPWGNGFLCLDGQLYRVLPPTQFNSTGSLIRPLDLTTNPGFRITPSSTWNFQVKYRDVAAGGANFNSSNAVRVTFCP